uniref:Ig-like domain-containing protein n=2 Tax=Lepisosteus oculatus TaxID=7918 RepID=W5M925_LEPOC
METTMRHWQAISFACLFLKLATQAAPALPGEVVIKPENPAVQVGQPVSVTCTTTCPAGKPAWRKGIDASRFLVRSTAQESTMEIGIAELEDEGDYTCLSRCGEATKRKKTRVHVFAFPEPVVRTVPENPISGRLFDVFCSWRGVYPPEKASLRLFHGGKAFGSEPEESEQEDSRLSNYELKVTNQTGAGSTEYRCEADLTVNGQVLLKNTTLPIQFKDLPQITSVSPDSIAAELGRSASFSCRAQPEPSLLISWEKEGTEGWQLPQRWRQTRSPGRLQVDIQQLRVEDSGNYSCVLRNEAGQVRRGLSIDVLYGPRNAESSPSSLSVRVGEPVTLSCSWDAHPPAIITWTKDSAVPP